MKLVKLNIPIVSIIIDNINRKDLTFLFIRFLNASLIETEIDAINATPLEETVSGKSSLNISNIIIISVENIGENLYIKGIILNDG